MSARRDVGKALKKKDKRWKETHVIVCISLKKTGGKIMQLEINKSN